MDSEHSVPRAEYLKEMLGWLDRYFGPARQDGAAKAAHAVGTFKVARWRGQGLLRGPPA